MGKTEVGTYTFRAANMLKKPAFKLRIAGHRSPLTMKGGLGILDTQSLLNYFTGLQIFSQCFPKVK